MGLLYQKVQVQLLQILGCVQEFSRDGYTLVERFMQKNWSFIVDLFSYRVFGANAFKFPPL